MLAKTQAINQARDEFLKNGGNIQDFKIGSVFKARDLTPISIRNEQLMLKKLITICINYLCKYPTSYKHDLEILERDRVEHYLTVNQRNCILLRCGEKRILHFIIDNAQKLLPLLENDISLRDARYIVNGMFNFQCQLYCDVALFPLLKEREGSMLKSGILN